MLMTLCVSGASVYGLLLCSSNIFFFGITVLSPVVKETFVVSLEVDLYKLTNSIRLVFFSFFEDSLTILTRFILMVILLQES